MKHPLFDDLLKYAQGGCPPGIKKEVEEHLRGCSDCVGAIAAIRRQLAAEKAVAGNKK